MSTRIIFAGMARSYRSSLLHADLHVGAGYARESFAAMRPERRVMLPPISFHLVLRIGSLIGVLAAILLLPSLPPALGAGPTKSMINCNIQQGVCESIVDGTKVTLDILPKPVRAMCDLTFRVTVCAPGKISAVPYIDLNMPAMDMGPNRVLLKDLGRGVFEGQGVIVRCMSGKRTWRARIMLPNIGQADFIFDVVY
jgi:hypothetical protein